MVVQHNMQAMNDNRILNITTGSQAKSTEKLSSGYKINRAADDAAGLSISEKMRKQIRGLDQASTNAEDGVSAVQTAEGALTEVHSMLQRMNELAVQAANGTNSETDRESIQAEIDQLTTEIDRVAETTKFNETYMLKGDKSSTKKAYLSAHDAGLVGKLQDNSTTAKFTMDALKQGDKITIAGKDYTIGVTKDDADALVDEAIKAAADTGKDQTISLDGKQYTIDKDGRIQDENNNKLSVLDDDDADGDTEALKALVKAGTASSLGTTVKYGDKEIEVMTDVAGDGVDDNNASIITTDKAYQLVATALTDANEIGNTDGTVSVEKAGGTATLKADQKVYDVNGNELDADKLAATLDANDKAVIFKDDAPTQAVAGTNYDNAVAQKYDIKLSAEGAATGGANVVKIAYKDADGKDQSYSVSVTTANNGNANANTKALYDAIDADTSDAAKAFKATFDMTDDTTTNAKIATTAKTAGANSKITGISVTTKSGTLADASSAETTAGEDAAKKGAAKIYDKAKGTEITTSAELTAALKTGATNVVTGTEATKGTEYTYNAASSTEVTFNIGKGYTEVNGAVTMNLHVGADADMTNKIGLSIDTMNSKFLGISGLDVVGVGDDNGAAATYAVDAIADAIAKVSAQRSTLGAVQNRLEHTIANLDNVVENSTAAESRIRDTDMAEEMVGYSKNNILAQAGQSMLAQANQANQGVLSLLG